VIKFKFLTGGEDWPTYGGKFISPRQSNGEFDYYLVLDFVNMHEATGEEDQDKYYITVLAVAPGLNEEVANQQLAEYGLPEDYVVTEEMKADALASYGIAAHLKVFSGNNYHKLLREAKKECQTIPLLFGFYMDRPENRLGATGWDFIAGNPLAPLGRSCQ